MLHNKTFHYASLLKTYSNRQKFKEHINHIIQTTIVHQSLNKREEKKRCLLNMPLQLRSMSRLSERILMASRMASGDNSPEGLTTFSSSVRLISGKRTACIISAWFSLGLCLHQFIKAWKISFSGAAKESLNTILRRAAWKRNQTKNSSILRYFIYFFLKFNGSFILYLLKRRDYLK